MRGTRAILTLPVLVLTLAVSTGCYSLTPVSSPTPGMDVRVRLKVESAVRRSEEVDEPIRNMDGRIVEVSDRTVALDVLIARGQTVFENVVIRDTITFARNELESILERKFSPVKTSLVVVAIGAGGFLVVKGIQQVVGGTNDEPPGDGTNADVVPAFRTRRLTIFSIPLFRFR